MNSVYNAIKRRSIGSSDEGFDDEDLLGPGEERVPGDAPYSDIAAATGSSPQSSSSPAGATLSDLDKQQQSLRDIRQSGVQANGIANLGSALSGLARGGSAPPSSSDLYSNLQSQNQGLVSGAQDDVKQRLAVMKAIQANATKSDIAKLGADTKTGVAQLGADTKLQLGDQSSQNKSDFLKSYDARTQASSGIAGQRLGATNIRTAAGITKGGNIDKEVTKLNSAKSAQTLIDGIRSGEITDSSNVKSQLTNLLTSIELGAPGGQGDRHNMGVDTLYSRAQGALSYIEGHPNSTIPKEYLDQIETEAHALGDRAAKNYKGLTDAAIQGSDLSGGDPNADAGQVNQLAKQKQKSFLQSAGYDPETAAPAARPGNKTVIKVLKNKQTGAIKTLYSDGSEAITNGQ